MIGKQETEHEEEPELKVMDRRKFNVDGSLRDGVTIEKEPPRSEVAETPLVSENPVLAEQAEDERPLPEDDPADEKDPASFVNFLSTLVTNAAASLGAIPHPVTGQKSVDLESGKYWIDVLTMLRKKTEGNLSAREKNLLTNILSDLQLQFVSINRAAEEQLKAQAAQKFSSKDVLGG